MSLAAQESLIRPMTVADLDRVMEIAAGLTHAPHWLPAAYLAAVDPQAAPLRIALVAADPATGTVTGFVVASLLPPQAELESIAVAIECQRRGLARQLFAQLLWKLRPHGITEVTLELRASNNPALQLYRALGFRETSRRPRYYADPVEDAILMTLHLPSST